VLITHEEEVARHTERAVHMRDGRIVSDERLGARHAASVGAR